MLYALWFLIVYFAAHHDQQALLEKMDSVRRELEEERGTGEKVRRDATTRMEQDRASLNQLRDELSRLKTKMEEFR